MTALPPPAPRPPFPPPNTRSQFLPPVLPRQKVLVPAPPRPHFYDGYGRWHWAALIVGLAILTVIFLPAYLGILELFK